MGETFKTIVARMWPGRHTVSCAEMAVEFVVSPDHIRRLCETGELRADPIPSRNPRSVNYWRIPLHALVDFLCRRTIRRVEKSIAKPRKHRCRRSAHPVQPS